MAVAAIRAEIQLAIEVNITESLNAFLIVYSYKMILFFLMTNKYDWFFFSRHELAMQHYRTVSDPQEGGDEAEEEENREDEEVEVVEDVSFQPQTMADLRAVQQLELRHPAAPSDLQVCLFCVVMLRKQFKHKWCNLLIFFPLLYIF